MSALPPKANIALHRSECPLCANSGHWLNYSITYNFEPIFIKRLWNCHTGGHSRQADTDGGWIVLVPDYIAIGVLIVLIVWAVADWVPRGKL